MGSCEGQATGLIEGQATGLIEGQVSEPIRTGYLAQAKNKLVDPYEREVIEPMRRTR